MASIMDILMGAVQDESSYLAESPLFSTGLAIGKSQMPAPEDNIQALLMPIIQGGISGYLVGKGRENVREQMYQDYSKSPLADMLSKTQNIGPVANAEDYADLLAHSYGQEKAPEGWTPKIGKQDMMMGALLMQTELEAAQEAKKVRAGLLADLLKEGVKSGDLSPQGAISAVDEKGNIDLAKLPEGTESKKWWKDIPAADQQKITSAKGVISELDKLAKDLEEANLSAAEFQIQSKISGTKAYELKSAMLRMIPNSVRLMGEVGNLAVPEQERIMNATIGNWTSNSKEAAQRVRGLVGQASGIIGSKLESYRTAGSNPNKLADEVKELANKTEKVESNVPAGAIPTNQVTKDGRRIYILNGVKGVID